MGKRLTNEEFIEKARKVHGDKYDYSKTVYHAFQEKVCIICHIHGEFWQTPNNHLHSKYSCPKCVEERQGLSLRQYSNEQFKAEINRLYGDKFILDKTVYTCVDNRCIIECPIHGEIKVKIATLLQGKYICKKCKYENNERLIKDKEDLISKALKIYGDKYNYEHAEFIKNNEKVKIYCNKCGKFFYQTPYKHINEHKGCPYCNFSHLEQKVELFLQNNNIDYISQYKINHQRIDFYLTKYNLAIECQGKQHFGLGGWTKNEEKRQKQYELTKQRDLKKFNYCKENEINIIYFLKPEYNHNALNLDIGIYNEKNIINNIENIVEFIKKMKTNDIY